LGLVTLEFNRSIGSLVQAFPKLSDLLTSVAANWPKLLSKHRRTHKPIAMNVPDHTAGDLDADKTEAGGRAFRNREKAKDRFNNMLREPDAALPDGKQRLQHQVRKMPPK